MASAAVSAMASRGREEQMMDTMTIGTRLVELCREGKHRQAIEELYADEVLVNEAMPNPGMPHGVTPKSSLLVAADKFFETMEVHGGEVDGPYPWDDKFICFMRLDATPTEGPMAGQRMDMREACVYRTANGKITESHFCYHVPSEARY